MLLWLFWLPPLHPNPGCIDSLNDQPFPPQEIRPDGSLFRHDCQDGTFLIALWGIVCYFVGFCSCQENLPETGCLTFKDIRFSCFLSYRCNIPVKENHLQTQIDREYRCRYPVRLIFTHCHGRQVVCPAMPVYQHHMDGTRLPFPAAVFLDLTG
ncbi:MAG: hypothetical protein CSA32_02195 [Desulfobulbus propionicus]|nr:MAG: hypothetical protein CSA32_02195 [Desulfobulbus propionicus]